MSRTLVAFFSASGTTKRAAEEISKLLKCDIYEIKPKTAYTGNDLDWNKKDSRSTVECKNRKSRPPLADKNVNISNYDTILVGFPVWWYLAPNVVLKKIVVWGTSWSSGMGNTTEEIRGIVRGANVVEGVIFDRTHLTTSDYKKFISNLKL